MDNINFYKGRRYSIAPLCPCGKDNKDGKFIPLLINGTPSPIYGFCYSCGKHFNPEGKSNYLYQKSINKKIKIEHKSVPYSEVKKTMSEYDKNNFIIWLKSIFPDDYINAIKRYRIGTSLNYRTLFWYISIKEEVRTGKSISYDAYTGKRDKKIPIYSLYTKENGYSICLFGEHLLKDDYHKTIFIVESEKTAIVGSLLFPKYTWLATGGANGLTVNKATVLESRKVIYIPDCDEAGRNSISRISSILKIVNARHLIMDYFIKNFNDGEDIVDLLFINNKLI
ncbi:MAG: DUF6371 domain-containing protein [Bacteroidales bacterium]|jgi:hypothetical protein|nr:DUF6371 domain-containing protein [Bacteroidales bacterium]